MEVYYNIHNIVKIHINTKRSQIIKEYDYYLRNFRVQESYKDVDIEIKDFEEFILPENALNMSNELFGFEGGIYNKKNEYALEFENSKLNLFIKDTDLCINTIMEYFLTKKNCTFIHGAAISYKGKGIIFPAPPNTGKTLLVSKLRKNKDVKIFADDYFIVNTKPAIFSYLMDFSIYNYHFKFFPELKNSTEGAKIKKAFFERALVNIVKDLPIKKKLKRVAQFLKYNYLEGGEFLKIPASRLISQEKFGNHADLGYGIFLERYNGSEFKVEKISPEKAVNEVIGILQREWQGTMPIYHILSSFGVLDLTKQFNDTKSVANLVFEKIKLYKVLMPINMDNETRLANLESFLEREIFINI